MGNNRFQNAMLGLGCAIATAALVMVLGGVVPMGSYVDRILQIMGSQFPDGLVQFFTFWLFYFALFEIRHIRKRNEQESTAYELNLLPEAEQYVLDAADVNKIKLHVLRQEESRAYLLTDLIKKACTKYRSNKSTSEALEIVTAQVRINQSNAESEQSMIRYAAWAIPSVGFIGTIIGIAGSLGNVTSEMGNAEIQQVTQSLYVAFDTTLLSLFLSIVLMFQFHVVQEAVEKFHTRMESYVIENLINRIYHK